MCCHRYGYLTVIYSTLPLPLSLLLQLVSECAPVNPELPRPQAHSSPSHLEFNKESDLEGNPTAWLSGSYGKSRPHKLVQMTSLYSDVGSDDSSELPTPYREDVMLEGVHMFGVSTYV